MNYLNRYRELFNNIFNNRLQNPLQDSESDGSSTDSDTASEDTYDSDYHSENNLYPGAANDSEDDFESEIVNQKYYLGSYKNIDDDVLIIGTRIDIQWFYNNTFDIIYEYIYWYSGVYIDDPQLHIIQCFKRRYNWITNQYINEDNEDNEDTFSVSSEELLNRNISTMYICVLKTYWIRLIQRTWKRIFQQKQRYREVIQRNAIYLMRLRELHGVSLTYPGLHGMLNYLVLQKQGLFVKC